MVATTHLLNQYNLPEPTPCKCGGIRGVRIYHSVNHVTWKPELIIGCLDCRVYQMGNTREEAFNKWNVLQLIS